jgi:DNA-binding response OmpR family regulator
MGTEAQKRILIVDDNPRLLRLLELRFSQTGYTVYTAEKIKDAVVTAIIVRPDLIITEVMMPEINGWEFKKLLNKIPHMIDIPFIFLTSTESLPDELYAQDFGMSDYMQKPYAFDDLLSKVEKNLRRYEQRQRTLTTGAATSSGTLNDMSLTDILQVLAMNKRSCTVRLVKGEKSGEIFFKHGRVCDASAGTLHGEEAIYYLLGWEGANFWVGENSDGVEETISKDVHTLIAEGLKRFEESPHRWSEASGLDEAERSSTEPTENGERDGVLSLLYRLQDRGILKEIGE